MESRCVIVDLARPAVAACEDRRVEKTRAAALAHEDPRLGRTREKALEAARTLFSEHGLDAVTHLRVAHESGVGRKTLYRHWPEPVDLIRATLSTSAFPRIPPTGDLIGDLAAHLESLRRALVDGPLARIVAALAERSASSPTLRAAREALVEEGCAPIEAILSAAVARGELPPNLDKGVARAALEGPLFYRVLVLGERVRPSIVTSIVATFAALHGRDARPRPAAHAPRAQVATHRRRIRK